MKPAISTSQRTVTACLFLAGVAALNAFVGSETAQGNLRRWRLSPPHPSVSTNVVNPTTRAIRFFLAADAFSSTNRQAELDSIRAAFGQWQAVPGTILKFEDAGLATGSLDVNLNDNTNLIFWTKSSTLINSNRTDISGSLGLCFTSFLSDGTLLNADIVLNGVEFGWHTDFFDTQTTNAFVENVALHEIGHLIGLAHAAIGTATMLYHGDFGTSRIPGLSSDDISGVCALYGTAATISSLGHLQGQITVNGTPVFGAVVSLEDDTGTLVAATPSRTNGLYQLPCVPAGHYTLRVTPLDPAVPERLISGPDIANSYATAQTSFLPNPGAGVTLTAGATNTLNLTVTNTAPPFRITWLRQPSALRDYYFINTTPIALLQGQSNFWVGVFSGDLPSSGLTLQITGPGVTILETTNHPMNSVFANLAGISVRVAVASNATPGARSLVVIRTSDGARAYANGFFEIQSTVPDYNFDGLDDRFQRTYFSPFTSPAAAPQADPDQDGMSNSAEYIAGTNPTNSISRLAIESVTQTVNGATIRCRTVPGKRYQLYSRPVVASGAWQPVGTPIIASGNATQWFDPAGTGGARYYRVGVMP